MINSDNNGFIIWIKDNVFTNNPIGALVERIVKNLTARVLYHIK